MPTLLLLVLLSQAAPVHPPEVASCDLTAIPVVCDIPALTSTTAAADPGDLCSGNFVENCKRYALDVCHLSVGQVKASVQGSTATCSVTCSGMAMEKKKSCELNSTNPIAKCIYPACPAGCLDCVDLSGGRTCHRSAISDDPDPVVPGAQPRQRRQLEPARNTAPPWVCE